MPRQVAHLAPKVLVRRRGRRHEQLLLRHAQGHHFMKTGLAQPQGLQGFGGNVEAHDVDFGEPRHTRQGVVQVLGPQ